MKWTRRIRKIRMHWKLSREVIFLMLCRFVVVFPLECFWSCRAVEKLSQWRGENVTGKTVLYCHPYFPVLCFPVRSACALFLFALARWFVNFSLGLAGLEVRSSQSSLAVCIKDLCSPLRLPIFSPHLFSKDHPMSATNLGWKVTYSSQLISILLQFSRNSHISFCIAENFLLAGDL